MLGNENWTRTWDGLESEVLIKQKYENEDQEKFIIDCEKYLLDERYIKIDGEPVILVYKPSIIPNVGDVFAAWRKYWRLKHKAGLKIWCVRTDGADHGFANLNAEYDAIVEFPPHVVPASRHPTKYKMVQSFAGIDDDGHYYDYRKLVDDIVGGNDYSPLPSKKFYRGVMLAWDNSARRSSGQSIWYGFSLEYYYKWLKYVIRYSRENFPQDQRFIFINAWNEWAEGTYLEPDVGSGYANLNTTSRALFDMPLRDGPLSLSPPKSTSDLERITPRIAVHFHIFYSDLAEECALYLRNTGLNFDLFITTNSQQNKEIIEEVFRSFDFEFTIMITPNQGRDVGPMLYGVGEKLLTYDIIGHFHTKRSKTVSWGDHWRRYLFDNLLPAGDEARTIIHLLSSNTDIGVVSAPTYPLLEEHIGWGNVEDRVQSILCELGYGQQLPSTPHFPVGNMFWARVDAIRPVLARKWSKDDFEPEEDQVGETLAHCLERILPFVCVKRGYEYKEVLSKLKLSNAPAVTHSVKKKRLSLFVHYSGSSTISAADFHLLSSVSDLSDRVIFISNSVIDDKSAEIVRLYADQVIIRDNVGFDFAAWKVAIESAGWEKIWDYDELVLCNNSCWGPIYDLEPVFAYMQAGEFDFWGITSFPESKSSDRPEAVYAPNGDIPWHIQSYFMVFGTDVLRSVQFYRFWDALETKTDMLELIVAYEMGLTAALRSAGFKPGVYVPESEILQSLSDDARFNHPYNRPDQLVLLKSPLIKKRSSDYAPDKFIAAREMLASMRRFAAYLMHR